ncbi:MAG: acetyl-CoA C-acyltransferase [Terriglobales bacterium]|jgi:acetyl-CoA acetyltransferase family protein
MQKAVVILGGARTPMADYCGQFKDMSATELATIAAKAALERSGTRPDEIDHTVMGNVMQAGSDAIYASRHVALRAGVPIDRPALTVNRLCGSGIQSIVTGAQMIQLGEAQRVLAGGMESMSQAPFVVPGARWGLRLGSAQIVDMLMASLFDPYCGLYMAQTAEKVAGKYGVTREDQDVFAALSHSRAAQAQAAGKHKEEIQPVEIKTKKGVEQFATDDHIKPDTSPEVLAKLKPAFGKDGSVTGGNASGIVDAGAAVVIADESAARNSQKTPLGRIVSWGIAGVDPSEMGMGPVPATKQALAKAGLKLTDIDLIELNEAFAAQYLGVEKELELDREKTNVNGGAIALGHPLGATGTRLVLTLLLELRRRKKKYGLATACIGGGQGIAIIVESYN